MNVRIFSRPFKILSIFGLFALALAGRASAAPVASGPYLMEVRSEGKGWMLTSVLDSRKNEPPTELYIIAGEAGINNSPLPVGEKRKLLAPGTGFEPAVNNKLFIVHKEIVESYWNDGFVPMQYLTEGTTDCESTVGRIAESFALSYPLEGTLPFEEGTASGEIDYAVEVKPELDLVVQYRVDYTGTFLCVPSSVAIDFFDLHAAIQLVNGRLGMTVQSEFGWEKTYQKKIFDPTIWRLTFPIGYFPVVINFKLPVNIGIELSTGAVGSTTVGVDWNGSFGLDYRCVANGCTGTSSHSFNLLPPDPTPTAAAEVDLKAKPFFDARVRANLYSDSFFFAEVGLRPGVQNRLWGYFGNECGDGDGDGENEAVSGAMFDSYFDLQLPYAYGGLLGKGEDFADLYQKSIYFKDFLNPIENNALAPVLTGPISTDQHLPETYEVWMRPCYPLADDIEIGLRTRDGEIRDKVEFDLEEGNAEALVHSFENEGAQELQAVNIEDSISRNIGSYSRLDVAVDGDGGTGGGETSCDPTCPPSIIHDSWWVLDEDYPNDFRHAYYTYDYSLGWNIDLGLYDPDDTLELRVDQTYFDRDGERIYSLDHQTTFDPRGIEYYANMALNFFELTAPLHTEPIRKICVDIDPDIRNLLTTDDINVSGCLEFPTVLTATVLPGTSDVLLEWEDDDDNANNNSFDLLRSKNFGAFVTIASQLTGYQHTDHGLAAGVYQYALESHGEQYHSNYVTFAEAGPLPIFFYDENFFYDASGEPKMTVHITDDIPDSEDIHQHEVSVDGGSWRDSGLDALLSIDSKQNLHGYIGSHRVQFKTARWSGGTRVGPWNYSDDYDVLIRDWDLEASDGGPEDGDVPTGTIRLTWNQQPDVNAFTLRRSHSLTGQVVTLDIEEPSPYLDSDVIPGDDYSYEIRAFEEPWSGPAEGRALSAGSVPAVPGYLRATDDVVEHILVDWEAVPNATEYELYRRDSYVAEPEASDRIAVLPGAGSQFIDDEAPADVPVYYWLRGVNSAGAGEYADATGYRPSIVQNEFPDLAVQSLSAYLVNRSCLGSGPCPGRWVQIQYQVANLGEATVPGYTFEVRLSADEHPDPSDILISGDTIAVVRELEPGAIHAYGVSWPRPPEFIGHPMYILFHLDASDFVDELGREDNNFATFLIPLVD